MKRKHLFFAMMLVLAGCTDPISSSSSDVTPSDSSSSTEQTYTITADHDEGGNVELSATTAKSGETVTVTVQVNEGFELKEIKSDQVTLAAGEVANTYSFVMPAENVLIYADFAKYATFVSFKDYTEEVTDISGVELDEKYEVGTTVRFTVGTRYEINEYSLESYSLRVNDEIFDLSLDETNPTTVYADVVIPDASELYAFFCYDQAGDTGYTISFTENDKFKIIGLTNGAMYQFASFWVLNTEGYKVSNVYAIEEGSEDEIAITSRNGRYSYMPNANATIYVETEAATVSNIKYAGADFVDFEKSTLPTRATEGDFLSFKVVTLDGYYFEKATLSVAAKDSWSNDITEVTDSEFQFYMVGEDLTITFTINENEEILLIENQYVTNVTFYDDYERTHEVTSYAPGKTLHMKVELVEGFAIAYEKVGWEEEFGVTITSLATSSKAGSFYSSSKNSFTINSLPVGGISISFDVVEATAVTLTSHENGTLAFETGKAVEYYLTGEPVSFTVSANEGYQVDDVTFSDSSIYSYGNGQFNEKTYSFDMPGTTPITVTATINAISYATITVAELPEDVAHVSVNGYTSYETLNFVGSNNKFHIGEDINVSIETKSNAYTYALKVKQGETETDVELNVSDCYVSASFIVTDANVTLTFTATAATAATYTLDIDDGIAVQYYYNGKIVDSLDTIYPYDSVGFVVTSTPAENHKYVISVVDALGNDIYYSSWNNNSFTVPEGGFTLTIEDVEIKYASITVVNESTYDFSNGWKNPYWTPEGTYDTNYLMPSETAYSIEVGTVVRWYFGSYDYTDLVFEITVDGDVVYSACTKDGDISQFDGWIVPEGNVVFTYKNYVEEALTYVTNDGRTGSISYNSSTGKFEGQVTLGGEKIYQGITLTYTDSDGVAVVLCSKNTIYSGELFTNYNNGVYGSQWDGQFYFDDAAAAEAGNMWNYYETETTYTFTYDPATGVLTAEVYVAPAAPSAEGTWVSANSSTTTFTFNSDGTAVYFDGTNSYNYTYTVDGTSVSLTFVAEGSATSYSPFDFSVTINEDGTITVTYDDGDSNWDTTFSKQVA